MCIHVCVLRTCVLCSDTLVCMRCMDVCGVVCYNCFCMLIVSVVCYITCCIVHFFACVGVV